MDPTADRTVTVFRSGVVRVRHDTLVQQSQASLRINLGEPIILACSPGNIRTLCLGHLLTEGWLPPGSPEPVITVNDGQAEVSLPGVLRPADPVPVETDTTVPMGEVLDMVRAFGDLSVLHRRTGGTHSAALGLGGSIYCHSEDISRSSALERTAGIGRGDSLPLHRCVLLLSSRVPLALIRKAAHARIPLVAAISAPTAQAADEAERLGVCLCGFVRGLSANVYSCGWRVGL